MKSNGKKLSMGIVKYQGGHNGITLGKSMLAIQSSFGKLVDLYLAKKYSEMGKADSISNIEAMYEFVHDIRVSLYEIRTRNRTINGPVLVDSTIRGYNSIVARYSGVDPEWILFRISLHIGKLLGTFNPRDTAPDNEARAKIIVSIMALTDLLCEKLSEIMVAKGIDFNFDEFFNREDVTNPKTIFQSESTISMDENTNESETIMGEVKKVDPPITTITMSSGVEIEDKANNALEIMEARQRGENPGIIPVREEGQEESVDNKAMRILTEKQAQERAELSKKPASKVTTTPKEKPVKKKKSTPKKKAKPKKEKKS